MICANTITNNRIEIIVNPYRLCILNLQYKFKELSFVKYKKAASVLPDDLVKEIQKYIQGEYIYIPIKIEKKKSWGELSGIKVYIEKRNKDIRNKYVSGYKIKDLAEEFFLSIESIKKIVYSKGK